MSHPKLNIDPEQASALAILAQEFRVGAHLSGYPELTQDLNGDALQVAKVLFREIPEKNAKLAVRLAANDLRHWVESLTAIRVR
ncbi:hypothetical protein LVB77_03675 [Lysobacter sp. 5GHs7-4]|uniref:hypothetical protein n=1 Tax=Lysobacter sp. 5GHs7-4 TaxID=2904253 RepID=UPI001E3D6E4D|nr:hypothetical protein [Lysobacter sp. 5GHs7-4]UHQ23822.1 hypothetical protein LVB77_03675 [Lysobacter sp. 5GHs7-4]